MIYDHAILSREKKQNNFDPLMAFRALISPKAAIDTLMMAQYWKVLALYSNWAKKNSLHEIVI